MPTLWCVIAMGQVPSRRPAFRAAAAEVHVVEMKRELRIEPDACLAQHRSACREEHAVQKLAVERRRHRNARTVAERQLAVRHEPLRFALSVAREAVVHPFQPRPAGVQRGGDCRRRRRRRSAQGCRPRGRRRPCPRARRRHARTRRYRGVGGLDARVEQLRESPGIRECDMPHEAGIVHQAPKRQPEGRAAPEVAFRPPRGAHDFDHAGRGSPQGASPVHAVRRARGVRQPEAMGTWRCAWSGPSAHSTAGPRSHPSRRARPVRAVRPARRPRSLPRRADPPHSSTASSGGACSRAPFAAPTITASTRMRSGANVARKESHKPSRLQRIACHDALPAIASVTDDTHTMWPKPRWRRCGSAMRASRNSAAKAAFHVLLPCRERHVVQGAAHAGPAADHERVDATEPLARGADCGARLRFVRAVCDERKRLAADGTNPARGGLCGGAMRDRARLRARRRLQAGDRRQRLRRCLPATMTPRPARGPGSSNACVRPVTRLLL